MFGKRSGTSEKWGRTNEPLKELSKSKQTKRKTSQKDEPMPPELIERALEQATMEQLGRALAQKRLETPEWKGGRPRTKAPRCPCGAMTRKRALARGHHCTAD
jgi:hypothetical protein